MSSPATTEATDSADESEFTKVKVDALGNRRAEAMPDH